MSCEVVLSGWLMQNPFGAGVKKGGSKAAFRGAMRPQMVFRKARTSSCLALSQTFCGGILVLAVLSPVNFLMASLELHIHARTWSSSHDVQLAPARLALYLKPACLPVARPTVPARPHLVGGCEVMAGGTPLLGTGIGYASHGAQHKGCCHNHHRPLQYYLLGVEKPFMLCP